MLSRFFSKAANEIDRLSLVLVSAFYIAASLLPQMQDVPAWGSALRGAGVGTAFNDHREKVPVRESVARHYLNYYGFKNDKPRMAAAFGIGAALGAAAGEFTRFMTGSPVAGNMVAGPLAYCTSSVISATAPDIPSVAS